MRGAIQLAKLKKARYDDISKKKWDKQSSSSLLKYHPRDAKTKVYLEIWKGPQVVLIHWEYGVWYRISGSLQDHGQGAKANRTDGNAVTRELYEKDLIQEYRFVLSNQYHP